MSTDETTVGGPDSEVATPAEVDELNDQLEVGTAAEDEDDERGTKNDRELDEAANDQEREAIRQRRREERQRRKRNQHEKVDSLERTVTTLTEQNKRMAEQLAKLQNSDASAKLAQLDDAIGEADRVFNHYKTVMADATAKSDGNTAAQAMDLMLKARDRHTQLTSIKSSIVESSRQPRQAHIDPDVRSAAQSFQSRNSWYKGPQSNDADSKVLTLLDNEVAAAGFDPKTEDYWKELESRGKRYLPHRFSSTNSSDRSDYNGHRDTPRSPVAGASNRGSTTSESEGGFKLSAERVRAMKEAGIWEDPDRRKKMIATYRQMDRENA